MDSLSFMTIRKLVFGSVLIHVAAIIVGILVDNFASTLICFGLIGSEFAASMTLSSIIFNIGPTCFNLK